MIRALSIAGAAPKQNQEVKTIMKKLNCLCAILLLSLATTWAADTYVIKIRGHIIAADGGRTRVRETDLVLSAEQRLLLVVDTTNHVFDIVQSDSTGTNVMRQETHAENAAVSTRHRRVTFDVQENEGFENNIALINKFTGRLIGSGTITRTRGKARSINLVVSGVWNPNDNSTFKGVITGRRLP
jgi:hypothetical protein